MEFVREVLQRIHVCALPVEVHGQKGTQSARRGGAKLCFELRGVDVERVWVDVHQQRPRAGAHDGVDRGEKAERGRDDHVSRFDANRKQSQPQSIRSGGAADGFGHASKHEHLTFQCLNFRPENELLRRADALDSGQHFLAD